MSSKPSCCNNLKHDKKVLRNTVMQKINKINKPTIDTKINGIKYIKNTDDYSDDTVITGSNKDNTNFTITIPGHKVIVLADGSFCHEQKNINFPFSNT